MGWVLLVDDDITQLSVLGDVLCAAGFEVSTAASADAALALAIATAPDLDVIVTDHVLLDSTGADLVRRVRADGVDTPVVVLSGLPSLDSEYKGLQARILQKPVPPEELITILRRITSYAA